MRLLYTILLLAGWWSAYGQRTDSLVAHYWDRFDIRAEKAIRNALEEMPGFAELLSEVSPDIAAEAYAALMASAEANAELWYCLRDNAEETFHGPNAIHQDDEIYIRLLKTFMESKHCTEGDRIRFEYQMESLQKNRVGTRAADLALHLDNGGRRCMLSELCEGSDSTLLLFYDPLCDHCGILIEELSADSVLQRHCRSGEIRIIAIDVAPRRSWLSRLLGVKKKNPHNIPEHWIRTEDRKGQVMDELVYHLPFVPQVYVLGNGMVVRKKGSPSPLTSNLKTS